MIQLLPPLILSLLSAFMFRFSLLPYENRFTAVFGFLCLIYLISYLRNKSYRLWLLAALMLSLSFNLIVFPWIYTGIANLGQTGPVLGSILFLLQGTLLHPKIIAFILLALFCMKLAKIRKWELHPGFAAAFSAGITDISIPGLIPFFWGDAAGSGIIFRQILSLTGIYGAGFLIFMKATLLFMILQALYSFLTRKWHDRTLASKSKPAVTSNHISNIQNTNPLPEDNSDKTGGFLSDRIFNVNFHHALPRYTIVAIVILMLMVYIYGILRLARPYSDQRITVALIQPATGPAFRNRQPEEIHRFMTEAINRTLQLGLAAIGSSHGERPDILFIPESAIPFHSTIPFHENYSSTFHSIIEQLSDHSHIIYNELGQIHNSDNYYNLISHYFRQRRQHTYAKRALIPFGEYIPAMFRPLAHIFPESSTYIHGPEAGHVLFLNSTEGNLEYEQSNAKIYQQLAFRIESVNASLSLIPALCYEIMFPALIRNSFMAENSDDPGANIIVNPTNDSWFDSEIQKYHHLSAARMRSIETGAYTIRPALTGISAIIDPYGRIEASIPAEEFNYISRQIAFENHTGLFLTAGHIPVVILLCFTLFGFLRMDPE